MNGYRPMVSEWLQQRFPDTKFEFINAGIASTCSHTGAFRLDEHVLSKGRIDLLFAEFAVNDDRDSRTRGAAASSAWKASFGGSKPSNRYATSW